MILMESELWPNFLHECKSRNIPVIVANGRVSDRSFRRSMKFAFWFRRITANVTRFLMQSEADARRITALGAEADKVLVSGNIKYDIGTEKIVADADTLQLAAAFALTSAPLIIAGSTDFDTDLDALMSVLAEWSSETTPGVPTPYLTRVDHLRYGVGIARRAWLAPEHVLNTRSANELEAWRAARLS